MTTLITDIPSLSDEQMESLPRFRLKACLFQALFVNDSNLEFYEVVRSAEKFSSLMFPMITLLGPFR